MINDYIRTEAKNTLSAFSIQDIELLPVLFISDPIEIQHEGEIGVVLPTQQFVYAQPIEQSLLNLGIILINENGEIITPASRLSSDAHEEEVHYLVQHYFANIVNFANDEILMVSSANSVYYMSAIVTTINDSVFTFILYTDIGSVINFRESINLILGILLVIIGISAFIVAIILSASFKRAIDKLSGYANSIGNGNFNEKIEVFKHNEFEYLGVSMTKMAAMLQTYNDNQKRFFQNASHELRTPLMSIQGYAEGIIEEVFAKGEAAEVIIAESKKMDALISAILYISKLDSGVEQSSIIYSTDIKALVYDCHERLKVVGEKSKKQVVFDFPNESIIINTDEKKLEIVILNILSNALRHTASEIVVKCRFVKGGLELLIKDDGQGVDTKDLPFIFDRFYKGEKGNVGIGLSICKEIMDSLDGHIKVENLSHPYHGAVFTIFIKAS